MERVTKMNPFAKHESHSPQSLTTYKVLTIVSWLLMFIVSVYFNFAAPAGVGNGTIWQQNKAYKTPFSLNPLVTDLYWIALFASQLGYFYSLFSSDASWSTSAANLGSHHIVANSLQFLFILLWVYGHFVWAEIALIVNFFNLTSLYFRHPATARWVHVPVISAPLAWNYVALFWCGAAMFHAEHLAARILANIFIWSFLGWGLAFLVAFKDWTMGFAVAWLTASLAIHQLLLKVIAFQWIFAFVIAGLLFVLTMGVAVPAAFGKEITFDREEPIQDEEQAPLLRDE